MNLPPMVSLFGLNLVSIFWLFDPAVFFFLRYVFVLVGLGDNISNTCGDGGDKRPRSDSELDDRLAKAARSGPINLSRGCLHQRIRNWRLSQFLVGAR